MPGNGDPSARRDNRVQEFEAFGAEFGLKHGHPCDVSAGAGEARDVAGLSTGSAWPTKTMGIEDVAVFRAPVKNEPRVAIRSGLSRTRSAATSGSRAALPSTHRYSIRMFTPSFQPRARRPAPNVCPRRISLESEPLSPKMPMR